MANMDYSVKKFFKKIICEGEMSGLDFDSIKSIKRHPKKKILAIQFSSLDGRDPFLFVKGDTFNKWFDTVEKDRYGQAPKSEVYKDFVIAFLNSSEINQEPIQEIIDDSGNIIGDDDKPNNATNSMVGSSKWDTNRFAFSAIPKPKMHYYGPYGIGYVVW